MVVKVKDAETKRNKASVAHTGWNKRTKTSTTTPKKVCLYSSSLQLLFQQKICKSASDRAAGKPHTPCDWASCVKERGLMRSSPTVLQSSLSFLSRGAGRYFALVRQNKRGGVRGPPWKILKLKVAKPPNFNSCSSTQDINQSGGHQNNC